MKQVKKNNTQIIIKQASNHLCIKPGGLVIGDIRDELARDTMRAMESAILKNTKKDSYYVLVSSQVHRTCRNGIKSNVMVMTEKPPEMLGTMLFHVDNRKSKIDRLWVLPLDIPRPDSIISDVAVPEIGEAGKRMPLIY